MKQHYIFFSRNLKLVCVFLLVFIPRYAAANKRIEYKTIEGKSGNVLGSAYARIEALNDDMTQAHWRIESGDKVVNEQILMDGYHNTISWSFDDKVIGISLEGRKKGEKVFLFGVKGATPIKKEFDVKYYPFYVNPKWGLQHFAQSQKEQLLFWGFRRDTFEPVLMKAVNKGEEVIDVNGKRVKAFKVEWTTKGLGRFFFSRIYWFRSEDGLFVKQTGSNGKIRFLVDEQ